MERFLLSTSYVTTSGLKLSHIFSTSLNNFIFLSHFFRMSFIYPL